MVKAPETGKSFGIMFWIFVVLLALVQSSYQVNSDPYGKISSGSVDGPFQRDENFIYVPVKLFSHESVRSGGYGEGGGGGGGGGEGRRGPLVGGSGREEQSGKELGGFEKNPGYGPALTFKITTGKDSVDYGNNGGYGDIGKGPRSYITESGNVNNFDRSAGRYSGTEPSGYIGGVPNSFGGNVRNYNKGESLDYNRGNLGNYGKAGVVTFTKTSPGGYDDQKPISYGSSPPVRNYDGAAYGGDPGDYSDGVSEGFKKETAKGFSSLKPLRYFGGGSPKGYGNKPSGGFGSFQHGNKPFVVSYYRKNPDIFQGSSFITGSSGYKDGGVSTYGSGKPGSYDKPSSGGGGYHSGSVSGYDKVSSSNYGREKIASPFTKVPGSFSSSRDGLGRETSNNYGGQRVITYGKENDDSYGKEGSGAYKGTHDKIPAPNYAITIGSASPDNYGGGSDRGYDKVNPNYGGNSDSYGKENFPGNFPKIPLPNIYGKADDGKKNIIPIIIRLQPPGGSEEYGNRGYEQYNNNPGVVYGNKPPNNYGISPENYGGKPVKPSEGKKFNKDYRTSPSEHGRNQSPDVVYGDKGTGGGLDIFNLNLSNLLGVKLPESANFNFAARSEYT
ncbi:glycine-rich cell wall structural protein 1.8-like [Centruroides sculpturatus]|uniref:glycine-rich cell wall structural protein 1.8-like n=1 Tax=Centruroides sculpturatus TaxID=218467 RepID=UPI000C6EAB26|nr:glycine-rich cell wall structural protein 1.8-like [Centruroides sculpturatus]